MTGSESWFADKRSRVHAAPVEELSVLVSQWRQENPGRLIPWFDPDDGGNRARALVLMESPAPRTVRDGGSLLCSEDNPDATNRLLKRLREESGLRREHYVKWNVVPWAVLDAGGHPTAPTSADLESAGPALGQLLAALPNLRLVVTLGTKALDGYMRLVTLTPQPRLLPVLAAPHPSARNTTAREQAILRIGNALRSAATASRTT